LGEALGGFSHSAAIQKDKYERQNHTKMPEGLREGPKSYEEATIAPGRRKSLRQKNACRREGGKKRRNPRAQLGTEAGGPIQTEKTRPPVTVKQFRKHFQKSKALASWSLKQLFFTARTTLAPPQRESGGQGFLNIIHIEVDWLLLKGFF